MAAFHIRRALEATIRSWVFTQRSLPSGHAQNKPRPVRSKPVPKATPSQRRHAAHEDHSSTARFPCLLEMCSLEQFGIAVPTSQVHGRSRRHRGSPFGRMRGDWGRRTSRRWRRGVQYSHRLSSANMKWTAMISTPHNRGVVWECMRIHTAEGRTNNYHNAP